MVISFSPNKVNLVENYHQNDFLPYFGEKGPKIPIRVVWVPLQIFFFYTFYGSLNILFSYPVQICDSNSSQTWVRFWRGV